MTQKTPAQLRAEAEADLVPLGKQRIKLLNALEEIDAELRPKIVTAVTMEVPFRRIQDLTRLSPNTARAWHKSHAG